MKIAVIIPVLYSPTNKYYLGAIKSLKKSFKKLASKHTLSFVVVQNQYLDKNLLPKPKNNLYFLRNRINRGFTGAVNDGLFFANYVLKSDWCLVINDDVVVDENFFAKLVPELKNNRAVVSCGVADSNGQTQSLGMKYLATGLTVPLTDKNKTTNYFVGTAFFVSQKTITWSFEKFGFLLAEFFFAYAEDLELSIRLKKFKKQVFILKENLLTHFGSVTAKRGSAKQLFWGYRNLIFVILIHWSPLKILLFLPLLLVGQIYSLLILFKNKHFVVYPKIIWSVSKYFSIIREYRRLLKK